MYTHETKIRIRYGETDKMGFVYYGNYPLFYEIGRTEMLRSLGSSYKQIEEMGILMPVLSLQVKYIRPAYYDDEITIKTSIKETPTARIIFYYEIYNDTNKLINKGETVLAFINGKTNKPVRAPEFLQKLITIYL